MEIKVNELKVAFFSFNRTTKNIQIIFRDKANFGPQLRLLNSISLLKRLDCNNF